jgi:hypothetical protein
MSLMKGGPSHFDMDDAFCTRWTYEFKPRRGCYLLIRLGLVPLWRHYMQAGIEAAAKACE